MTHKWTQDYFPNGKYNRLYRAQQILQASHLTILFDAMEPITDVTQANEYLERFKLPKS